MKFKLPKVGEAKLAARIFDDKSFARCIIFNVSKSKYTPDYRIISLDEIDIMPNGGLGMYDSYSAGVNFYDYRELTKSEIYSLHFLTKKLTDKERKRIQHVKKYYGIDIAQIIDIKRIRKEKLQRINAYGE